MNWPYKSSVWNHIMVVEIILSYNAIRTWFRWLQKFCHHVNPPRSEGLCLWAEQCIGLGSAFASQPHHSLNDLKKKDLGIHGNPWGHEGRESLTFGWEVLWGHSAQVLKSCKVNSSSTCGHHSPQSSSPSNPRFGLDCVRVAEMGRNFMLRF